MKLARFFNGKIRNFILFATVITWGHLQPIKQYLGGANYGVINHNVSSCLPKWRNEDELKLIDSIVLITISVSLSLSWKMAA